MTMGDPCPVHLKVGKNGDEIIPIQHHIELGCLQMGSEGNCGVGIDLNHHELCCKVFAKVGEVGEFGFNFGEVSNSHRAVRVQTVSFDKHACLFKPRKEVVVITFEFNVAKTLSTEYMAPNSYVCLPLFIVPCCQDIEKLFKFLFAGRQGC